MVVSEGDLAVVGLDRLADGFRGEAALEEDLTRGDAALVPLLEEGQVFLLRFPLVVPNADEPGTGYVREMGVQEVEPEEEGPVPFPFQPLDALPDETVGPSRVLLLQVHVLLEALLESGALLEEGIADEGGGCIALR